MIIKFRDDASGFQKITFLLVINSTLPYLMLKNHIIAHIALFLTLFLSFMPAKMILPTSEFPLSIFFAKKLSIILT